MGKSIKNNVAIIAAISKNGVYGQNGQIPWHIKKDLENFKNLTTGNIVVMGRGTWESLPSKFRPLPNRGNIVITKTKSYQANGAIVLESIEEALETAQDQKTFFIGGASLWYYAMDNFAVEAWTTIVKQNYPDLPGTRFANSLTMISKEWPDFSMISEERSLGKNYTPFAIQHWVRM